VIEEPAPEELVQSLKWDNWGFDEKEVLSATQQYIDRYKHPGIHGLHLFLKRRFKRTVPWVMVIYLYTTIDKSPNAGVVTV